MLPDDTSTLSTSLLGDQGQRETWEAFPPAHIGTPIAVADDGRVPMIGCRKVATLCCNNQHQRFWERVLLHWIWRPLSFLLVYPFCVVVLMTYLFHMGWRPAQFTFVCVVSVMTWLTSNVLVVAFNVEIWLLVCVVAVFFTMLVCLLTSTDDEEQLKWGAGIAASIGVSVRLASLFVLRETLQEDLEANHKDLQQRLRDEKRRLGNVAMLPLPAGTRIVVKPAGLSRVGSLSIRSTENLSVPFDDGEGEEVGVFEGFTTHEKSLKLFVSSTCTGSKPPRRYHDGRDYMVRVLHTNDEGELEERAMRLDSAKFVVDYPVSRHLKPGEWGLLSKQGHPNIFFDGVKTKMFRVIFEKTIWICQGALAFGLAFHYHVGLILDNLVTLPERQQLWLQALQTRTSSSHTPASNMNSTIMQNLDATAASSEVLYPFFVFLFLALLRVWETVSEERSNLLHEEDEMLMRTYSWVVNWIANGNNGLWCFMWSKCGKCICCGRSSKSSEISKSAKLLRMRKETLVNNATHYLDLGEASPRRSKQASTDSRRLQELKCSLVEGVTYPTFTKYVAEEGEFTNNEMNFKLYAKRLVPEKSVEQTLYKLRGHTQVGYFGVNGEIILEDEEDGVPKGAMSGQHVIRAILQHRIGPTYGIQYYLPNNQSHRRVDDLLEQTEPQPEIQQPSKDSASSALGLLKLTISELRQEARNVGLPERELEEAASSDDQRGFLIPRILEVPSRTGISRPSAEYLRGCDLVRLIILLSKADQIMMHRTCWWAVVFTSLLHASLPLLWSMRELCVPLPHSSTTAKCARAQAARHDVQNACMLAGQCQYHSAFERWKHLDNQCDSEPLDSLCSERGHTLLYFGGWLLSVSALLMVTDLTLAMVAPEAKKGGLMYAHRQQKTWLRWMSYFGWIMLLGAAILLACIAFSLSGFKVVFKIYAVICVIFLGLAVGYDRKMYTVRTRCCVGLAACAAVLAVVTIFGDSIEHTLGFFLSYWLTFSLTIRLSKCFEDVYEKYMRIKYFLHMTPWSTLKRKHRIETYAVLPEFGLGSVLNIETWNKMRLFLERYDIKWDRERQLSVLWMLVAWILIAFYQLSKYVDPNKSSTDTESILVISSTFQLSVGISLILFYGNRTNELQSDGVEHMLRVKQAETISKAVMYITEHATCNLSDPEKKYVSTIAGNVAYQSESTHELARLPTNPTSPTPTQTSTTADWLNQLDRNRILPPPREFHMLEALISTVNNEHNNGGKDHWGAEDRRATLMGVIVMDRTKLYSFWSSVATVLIPVAYKGFVAFFSEQARGIADEITQNMTCTEISREIFRDLLST